jgi:uncharacterized protein
MSPDGLRALFDVNLLVALLDEQHVHHTRAHQWWSAARESGWASCPLTENGFLRVISQPAYPNPVPVSAAHELLGRQRAETDHAFWPADVSILDTEIFARERLLGPKQLTDVYLLALAVKHGGCLATIDGGVSLEAVRGAEARHLAIV